MVEPGGGGGAGEGEEGGVVECDAVLEVWELGRDGGGDEGLGFWMGGCEGGRFGLGLTGFLVEELAEIFLVAEEEGEDGVAGWVLLWMLTPLVVGVMVELVEG